MPQIDTLLKEMPSPSEVRMKAEGHAVWVAWEGALNPAVMQVLQDYGGLLLQSSGDQAVVFFFSSEVFLAAARLEAWARFDKAVLTLAVTPASLEMGDGRAFRLALPEGMVAASLNSPTVFTVWLHPDATAMASALPGLRAVPGDTSAAPGTGWAQLQVDPRMPYDSTLGWYAILRPLGSPLDKEFQTGWRNIFDEIEKILQRNKFRYTIHDYFLMFPLESLRQMKTWVVSYLEMIAEIKRETPAIYWPCVLAVANRRGLTFNNDLPSKVGLEWSQLAADHPYMSFRNALCLGEGFNLHEVRIAKGKGPEEWCNVSLAAEDSQGQIALPLLTPGSLVLGEHPTCFYCGQRGHAMRDCPTRTMPARDKDVWRRIAGFDFAAMKDGMRVLEEAAQPDGWDAACKLLDKEDACGIMGRGLFDIGHMFQLRSLSTLWRARSKAVPTGQADLADPDHHPVWDALRSFVESEDRLPVERGLNELMPTLPRDFRMPCLLGFMAMERGDASRAAAYWQEAAGQAPSGFVQAWILCLQGRAAECDGKYPQAISLYDQALRSVSGWLFPAYRKIVCQVKTGFADAALHQLCVLLQQDANYFNMAILDPEMERGQIQILTGLGQVWNVTEAQMQDEALMVQRLRNEIVTWFTPEHPFAEKAADRIKRLEDLSGYHNYVPYMAAIQGRAAIERDMHQTVARESREFRARFKGFLAKLAFIQSEAAWFPFPRIMVEFNKNYNLCAASLNWAMKSNLQNADAFRRALIMSTEEEKRIAKLEKRLKSLRLIRDTTLFVWTFVKSFLWIEIIGLLVVLVVLPLVLYYAQKSELSWPLSALVGQQWQVQKAAIFIISLVALTFAGLRTVLRFDKIRDALLDKARRTEKARQARRKEQLAASKKRT